METRRMRWVALLAILIGIAGGCRLEPEEEPAGTVTVEDTLASELGTCQVVLSVENIGEVEISELDIVFSITTNTRRYYRRIVEAGSIPPGETAGLVEEITLDSPEETVDPDATQVEWRCFS